MASLDGASDDTSCRRATVGTESTERYTQGAERHNRDADRLHCRCRLGFGVSIPAVGPAQARGIPAILEATDRSVFRIAHGARLLDPDLRRVVRAGGANARDFLGIRFRRSFDPEAAGG